MANKWKRVVFSCEVDEWGKCPECDILYENCPCPGPTQLDEYRYKESDGVLYAIKMTKKEKLDYIKSVC